jgi:hypothetical protein
MAVPLNLLLVAVRYSREHKLLVLAVHYDA